MDCAVLGVECCPLAEELLPTDRAQNFALAFRALGDPVRLQLLSQIATHPIGDACVYDLTSAHDLTGPTISHHLRVLRESGLIDCQRRGNRIHYRVISDNIRALAQLLTMPVEADQRAGCASGVTECEAESGGACSTTS